MEFFLLDAILANELSHRITRAWALEIGLKADLTSFEEQYVRSWLVALLIEATILTYLWLRDKSLLSVVYSISNLDQIRQTQYLLYY